MDSEGTVDLWGQMNLLVDLSDEDEQRVTMGWLYSPVDGGPYDGWIFDFDIHELDLGSNSSINDCWHTSGRPFNATTFMDSVVSIEQDVAANKGNATDFQNWGYRDSDNYSYGPYWIECPDSGATDPRCTIYFSFKRS